MRRASITGPPLLSNMVEQCLLDAPDLSRGLSVRDGMRFDPGLR